MKILKMKINEIIEKNSNSKNESKEKKKRRTKNNNLGRTFICKLSGISYKNIIYIYNYNY